MEEHEAEDTSVIPLHVQMLGIPEELKLCRDVYRTSPETLKLSSEVNRTIYSSVFIEDYRLGPLAELCVRALGGFVSMDQLLPSIRNDPVKMRIYFDSLSVDLPLEKCYFINDEKYWRRVVLAKSKDKNLAFKKSYEWKSFALSIKFVELVEGCQAEYWPEDEMKPLAMMIKDDVTEMHIRRLKSLQDFSFNQYFLSDSELSSDDLEDSTDVSALTPTPVPSVGSEEDEPSEPDPMAELEPQTDKTEEELMQEDKEAETARRHAQEVAEIQEARRAEKLKRIEQQRERREARAERRMLIALKKPPPTPPPPPPPKKGKKPPKVPQAKGVFDIEIEPPEDDGEAAIVDKRNMEKLLRREKRYKYPARDCHHINLRFLRFFENLVVFTIEFQGPELKRDFHERHLNFSYWDMENLAFGVASLEQLKVFRLRSSRMDARKLNIITKALQQLPNLEVVDFGYDQLQDDCGLALYQLLNQAGTIKSLELEHNDIGAQALRHMSTALYTYAGTLEYLGLSGNPLGDQALHALTAKLIGSNHVSHLNLRSASISQAAIVCCICNELIKSHTALVRLDVSSVHMDDYTGIELLKVLYNNRTLLFLDYCGCDLDPSLEYEVEMLLKRNQYISKNPYIGDDSKTKEEIEEFVESKRNPIYVKAVDAVIKRAECNQVRPMEYAPSDAMLDTLLSTEAILLNIQSTISQRFRTMSSMGSHKVLTGAIAKSASKIEADKADETYAKKTPFIYDPNNFTEEEFYRHVYVPGPPERYCYFQLRTDPNLTFGKCVDDVEKNRYSP